MPMSDFFAALVAYPVALYSIFVQLEYTERIEGS